MQLLINNNISKSKLSTGRATRLCTILSPIKESRRENGSSQELRCSPERWSITSPSPTPSACSEAAAMTSTIPHGLPDIGKHNTASLERHNKLSYGRRGAHHKKLKKRSDNYLATQEDLEEMPFSTSSNAQEPSSTDSLSNNPISQGAVKARPSSRIR